VTFDEAARREVDDLRLRDLRVEVEVEVLERARALEARAADARLELLGVTTLDLVGEQAVEEFAVAEIVVGSLARAQLEGLPRRARSSIGSCTPSARLWPFD